MYVLVLQVDALYSAVAESGWMSDWAVRRRFSSPGRVRELTRPLPALLPLTRALVGARTVQQHEQHKYRAKVKILIDNTTLLQAGQAARILPGYLLPAGAAEWEEQHLAPLTARLEWVAARAASLTNTSVWLRGPVT